MTKLPPLSVREVAILGAALAILLAVFALYLQPEFMVTLAQQLWACL